MTVIILLAIITGDITALALFGLQFMRIATYNQAQIGSIFWEIHGELASIAALKGLEDHLRYPEPAAP